MQARSRSRAVATPRQPQSVAALLPAGIVDCILSHFDFGYSLNTHWEHVKMRDSTLRSMSVVAGGWTGPARRWLCRSVVVRSEEHLLKVPEWAGSAVRVLEISGDGGNLLRMESTRCWKAIYQLLLKLPQLRSFQLKHVPEGEFRIRDSIIMRSTTLLPFLHEIIVRTGKSRITSILADLFATSGGNVTSCQYDDSSTPRTYYADEPAGTLEIGGALRKLEISHVEYGHGVLRFGPSITAAGAVGLQELAFTSCSFGANVRNVETLFGLVGPTLKKLKLRGQTHAIAPHLHLLFALTHLRWEDSRWGHSLPLCRSLPPSLSSLSLDGRSNYHEVLPIWKADPSLLPPNLTHLAIEFLDSPSSFELLPHVDNFSTSASPSCVAYLVAASIGTLPFKHLTIRRFRSSAESERVKLECGRLNVEHSEELIR